MTDSTPTISRALFYEKLEEFVKRVQDEKNAAMEDTNILKAQALAAGLPGWYQVVYEEGTRFIKVFTRRSTGKPHDVSASISYFVEKDTGIIFGAKSIKIYNPNHEYGTLLTIDEWNWAPYYAVHKEGKTSLIPKALRR